MSLKDTVDEHNRAQEKQVKDRVEPDDIAFPWEDAKLLSLLSKPIKPVYERSDVAPENEIDEKTAVSQSNQVIKKINSGCLLKDAENELSRMIEDAEGYRAYRLQFIASSILRKAVYCAFSFA